ncbi:phosphoenolpyruvate synthase [Maribacter hydrothermalis]|uniref:Phosphoenolpyruvate synthase n=2 Tax=Maribacter hydrothermalis TaxID=1836467 RepID=A0A1B7Z115_9FLAO|nr:PEP/pyruvate-binding domain-containing protein [Maribacter hydrothermalis]APQ18066.1 phosphoenolpyruvate synthase [Maribacter hydrothermalis]OBR36411.1 phosphoenolpyruvate synthase [Maribacter hydrothermalis]
MKNYNLNSIYSILIIALFTSVTIAYSQTSVPADNIKTLVEKYKSDIRGPYRDIRWFCTDGSIRQPKDPCPDDIGPGVQHARYKDEVVALGKSNHIFFGQILAFSNNEEIWDSNNNHSRLKQYQLDKYLRLIDDGWINKKSQYYRGSVQVEDEEAWGIAFYKWILAKDSVVADNFYFLRQSLKDIPHSGDDNVAQLMRSESKVISDLYTPFMDLRTKIHSQPEKSDIQKVLDFKTKNQKSLTTDLNKKLDGLVTTMQTFFKPVDVQALLNKSKLVKGTTLGDKVQTFVQGLSSNEKPAYLVNETAQLLLDIREGLLEEKRPLARLQLLDISLKLEELLFQNAPNWEPTTVSEQLEKICALTTASVGAGYLELWEWEQVSGTLSKFGQEQLSLAELTQVLETARAAVEWSAAMVKANYQEVVDVYTTFEPKSYAFIDDRIRGSMALHLGKSVGELGDFIAKESALTNMVMDIPNQSTFRGLNPGYAFGELVVVDGSSEDIEVSSDKIYIFQRSPSDLKPVAGIATVAEGNMVSHVQLLARNLGIPNAALSDANLQSLKKYDGDRVFYAVSNKGNVIIKPEAKMTEQERELFVKKERNTDKIEVPVEKIQLGNTDVLNMRNVDASDSGALCGPKAANLGQLKKMFPEQVVEGLVIPFGIFRDHMDQQMPGENSSYWEYLNAMFTEAERMRNADVPEPEVENYQLRQLETLREAIKKMPLKADFMNQLEAKFKSVLGSDLGAIPVFLRSDTNMEDLKDFTGAGLNLTLFNVLDKEKILNGVKEVWASPYTERSFKWRQKYLLNPENVFPSILVIPSVDVDYSGVLITKGINSGNDQDLTIAFSRGAGGAVDGQSAETYTIYDTGGYRLLAPAREPKYNSLPATGGTGKKVATFQKRVVNENNLNEIKQLAKTIRETLPKETNSDYEGAYDVELGFKEDKPWLFQIRPFVENKKALSSGYLESITPKINTQKEISLSTKL